MRRRTLLLQLASLALLAALPAPADAASKKTGKFLVASTPKAKSSVKGPDLAIDLAFKAPIDRQRSHLVLVLPGGNSIRLPSLMTAPKDHLAANATGLEEGDYTLRWQAAPVGGYLSKGEIAFKVT